MGRLEDAKRWVESIPADEIGNSSLGAELRALIARFRVHCGVAAPASLSENWFIGAVGERDAKIAAVVYEIERRDGACEVADAVDALRALDPGIMARLDRAWIETGSSMPLNEWVARFYPY